MADLEFDLSSTDRVCREVVNLAKLEGVETSNIHDAGSNAEALNAPVADVLFASSPVLLIRRSGMHP
jgi:hypothetical protein